MGGRVGGAEAMEDVSQGRAWPLGHPQAGGQIHPAYIALSAASLALSDLLGFSLRDH